MSNTFPHHTPRPTHFNLGVDRLASTNEIDDMRDPWLTTVVDLRAPHTEAEVHMPQGNFEALADPQQLPGV